MNIEQETDEVSFSDMDRSLIGWATSHGAEDVVAQCFGLVNWAASAGHTHVDLDEIPASLMNTERQGEIPAAISASKFVGSPEDSKPLIVEDGRLYAERYYRYESQLVERLSAMLLSEPDPVDIEPLQPGAGLFDADADNEGEPNWQAVAAFAALRHRLAIISGGPGTGKTYTVVRVLALLAKRALEGGQPLHIGLAAPTGKAASRLMDATRNGVEQMVGQASWLTDVVNQIPREAQTIHRLLGMSHHSPRPRYDQYNPLPHDVVIVDEASMVDLPMMAKLVSALRSDARLMLLGDRHQLASIESGAVLGELCESAGANAFSQSQIDASGGLLSSRNASPDTDLLSDHVITLQKSRRFSERGAIGQLARAVNAGDGTQALACIGESSGEVFHQNGCGEEDIQALAHQASGIYSALCEESDPEAALQRLGEYCILTAVKDGVAGSRSINDRVKTLLSARYGFDPGATWYHGRPVIIRRNDYRARLYNGDMGVAMRDDNGDMRIFFHDEEMGIRALLPSSLPTHETVYAMTIHKSQGSEFDTVVITIPDFDVPIATRELFYTGLTRARKHLRVYAKDDQVRSMTARRTRRKSGLGRIVKNNQNRN